MKFRMIAGPNGSGKSTIINIIKKKINTGFYLNADNVEKKLKDSLELDLNSYFEIEISNSKLQNFFRNHLLYQNALKNSYNFDFEVKQNSLKLSNESCHSYFASILIDFLRHELIKLGKTITFETVMSHHSKIDFLKKTKELGYKNYLYYIATEDVEINKRRVLKRVSEGGHSVASDKIESRYYQSLLLLKDAVKYTHRTFIFDSTNETKLILEIENNKIIDFKFETVPNWVDTYLLD